MLSTNDLLKKITFFISFTKNLQQIIMNVLPFLYYFLVFSLRWKLVCLLWKPHRKSVPCVQKSTKVEKRTFSVFHSVLFHGRLSAGGSLSLNISRALELGQ